MKLFVPKGYKTSLNIMQTEVAIKEIKDFFERGLADALNLTRISAPLFVVKSTGLNDNLNGVERPVSFDMKEDPNTTIEIIHSLAKWKRMALKRYGIKENYGIYTDMNAIRRDEDLDNTHSIYVDQWDWELVISKETRERGIEFLKEVVTKIYKVFLATESYVNMKYHDLKQLLPNDIYFLTSQELEDMYPNLSAKERENEITKKHKAVFLMQIGKTLNSGEKHDGRAPDYDDWELNGDILVWNDLLKSAFELSSMGIRVDKETLKKQLELAGNKDRENLDYHKMLLNDELPLTIGGGLGQSRICMFLLQKAHIGEVQASIWTKEIEEECLKNGINLL
ncbi:aspartate--ammonia ligase [Streptobacillus canis]|uniref:aspartate--ammonia ligase n=1 Tax=Streptobacillus canis TaxID=2678686 RepID=UPI0012E241E4|nr:aspartate--ammonia ligase [Streptobacillus canis]